MLWPSQSRQGETNPAITAGALTVDEKISGFRLAFGFLDCQAKADPSAELHRLERPLRSRAGCQLTAERRRYSTRCVSAAARSQRLILLCATSALCHAPIC